jgi:serpin B
MERIRRPLLGVLIAGALVACGVDGRLNGAPPDSSAGTAPSIVRAGFDVLANVTERETSPEADGSAVNAVVSGANDFALRFFKAAIGPPVGNAVVGNYSLSTALFLTMAGTGGETTDAFASMLGVESVDSPLLHPAVNALDLILEGRAADGLTLSTANKVFVQDQLQLRDEFLDIAVGSYGAPVAAVDFSGAPDEVTEAVNTWVSKQTEGFIDELTDGYPPETLVVLANAMYLKASWAVEFHPLDQPRPFTTIEGEAIEVEMMGHDEYLPLYMSETVTAVELPYRGGNLAMVVVLPTADLAGFEAGLDAEKLEEITGGLEESGIHLEMPIWSSQTNVEALDPLHQIGLPAEYDFSGMLNGGDAGYFIDSISHVARIDVDETGTTAGAATDVAIAASHGPTVSIDRPFFYFIRDRGSGAILFMGHVTDPRD